MRRFSLAVVIGVLVLRMAVPAEAQKVKPAEGAKPEQKNEQRKEEKKEEKKEKKEGKSAGEEAERYPTKVLEVVTVIGKIDQTPIDYGGARSIISPEEIERSGTALFEELLRRTPSVHIFTETGTNSKPNFAIRGLNPERCIDLSILADGIPLAPAPYAYPGMSIHAFALPRVYSIDVIRSGYTVRYGPNNVGGIVNYLTRPIPERPTVGETIRIGSDNEFSSYTRAGGTEGPLGVLLENVYESGHTYRKNGDYEIKNYAAKLCLQAAENVRILFQAEGFTDHSEQAGGLSVAAYEQDPKQTQAPYDNFRGFQDRINTRVYWDLSEMAHFEVLAYGYETERTFYIGRPSQSGYMPQQFDKNPDSTTVWGIQPQFVFQPTVAGMDNHILVGLRYLMERVHYQRYRQDPWPTGPYNYRQNKRARYDAWSLFAEDRIDITDHLTLLPGLRVESVKTDTDDLLQGTNNSDRFLELLPAVSVNYRLVDEWSVYAAAQSSFRAPAVYNFSTQPGVPQDLDAERAWSYEVGTRGRVIDDALYFDLDFFYLDFNDRIVKDTSRPEGYVNQGHVVHQGVELAVDGDLGKLTDDLKGVRVFGAFNIVDTEIQRGVNKGNYSANAPPYKLNWGLTYTHPTGVWGGIDGFWVSQSYSDNENTRQPTPDGYRGIQPSYTIWNARVGYNTTFWNDRIKLACQTGINNLLDEEYFYRRSGKGILPGVPRRYYGSVSLEMTF